MATEEDGVQYTASEVGMEWKESLHDHGMKWLLDVDEGPNAHLVKVGPNKELQRHYHTENQWQVFLEGSCTLEGEEIEPIAVHFTEAGTEYGPIITGDEGLTFLTLREKPAGYHPVDADEEIESVRSDSV